MGTPESVCRGIDMILAVTLCTLLGVALGAPEAEPGHIGYGYHHIGYHHHGPICTTEYEDVVKEFCHYTPDKKCETKSHTYKVVTGYEKGECKEIEVCKYPIGHWRRRREAARKKVASSLVDCFRSSFFLDHYLKPHEFAFSDPTLNGIEFAACYMKSTKFLVYNR